MNSIITIGVFISLIFILIGYKYDKKEEDPLKEKIFTYRKKIVGLTIFSCFLICVVSGSILISWAFENTETNDIVETYMNNTEIVKTKTLVEEKKTEYIKETTEINFDYLKAINPNTKAWIIVEDTNINYPVVQARDNEYYLKHSFENRKNSNGWIFIDYRNNSNKENKNMIIYGHNRINKTMFGTLNYALNEDWVNSKKDHLIKYITPNTTYVYKIFSSYEIPVETFYLKTEFNDESYTNFVKSLLVRSKSNYGIAFNDIKYMLTLSTCSGNNDKRIVIHAYLVESKNN